MTKAEKKILKTVAGGVIGGVTGFWFGVAKIPVELACAATSPVTYPLVGATSGFLKGTSTGNTVKDTLVGAAIGVALVPFTPLFVAASPLNPVACGALGAAVGAYIGNKDK